MTASTDPSLIQALRRLCELVHSPTKRRLSEGTKPDWSAYPAIHEAIGSAGGKPSPELVGARMRDLLERAIAELRPTYPHHPSRISPLEVIEQHLLHGYSWDALVAEGVEQNRPVSERTLRSRQHDGLAVILDWCHAPEETAAMTPVPVRTSRFGTMGVLAAVVAVAAIASASWMLGGRSPHSDLHAHVGEIIPLPNGQPHFPDRWPAITLPDIDGSYQWAMIVEPEHGEFLVMATTMATGDDGGSVIAFDPRARRIVWQDRFLPTAEQLGAATEDEAAALLESFRPNWMIYGDDHWNLGDRIVVPYAHRFNHCFVVEYDLRSGERTGVYHHSGRLETHMFADLNDDGSPELILGGQDNELDLPVAVVLEPGKIRGAASTIPGTESEGACARVFLPAIPELQQHWKTERLQVIDQVSHRWNPELDMMSFHVGAANSIPAYRVSLTDRLEPTRAMPLSVGDNPAREWRSVGLDPANASDYASQIRLVGSCLCLPERARQTH